MIELHTSLRKSHNAVTALLRGLYTNYKGSFYFGPICWGPPISSLRDEVLHRDESPGGGMDAR